MVTKKQPQKQTQRIMKGQSAVYHDLFKLEPANMIKDIMIGDNKVLKESVPHVHFYHSVDSSGRPQKSCAPIGGHTHNIEVYEDEDGHLRAKCSLPFVRTMLKDKYGKRTEKILQSSEDSHTHECTYMESSEFKVRKMNNEALKALTFFQTADNPEGNNGQ